MQNLSAAVELAKEKGYSLSGLSVSLGHNKNYVSRILTRGASEETIEKVANEILQLLEKAPQKDNKNKALNQALKTIELQGVAFQELEQHAARLEASTIELAEQNHELTKQKNWAHTQLEQANAHVSGLRQLNQKYKAEARLASAFAAFFGFVCVGLGATLVWMVIK